MAVPLLDVPAQNGPLEPELQAAFLRVLQSGRYILGPEVQAFEEEMAADCGVTHAVGVSSGTDALLLALMSIGIGPGDEVLCPSFTFFATAGSIARTGATPVFVDSTEDTFNIDVADAATKITPRTRAIHSRPSVRRHRGYGCRQRLGKYSLVKGDRRRRPSAGRTLAG